MSASQPGQDEVLADDKAYVFHSWAVQSARNPVSAARGEGARFWDHDGKEFLDFASQLVNLNLGHQHPDLVAALHAQADRLCTIGPDIANAERNQLARLIVENSFPRAAKVFFTNAGADANEHAVRLARHATGKRKILTSWRSYHGATGTAIALTGEPRRWGSEPADSGVVHFLGPFPYRSSFYAQTPEEETARALAHLEQVIQFEGPGTIAAVMLETVVGTNGILVPPPGYLPGVRELCDRYGLLYIADEVMCGFGRTGDLLAVHGFGVEPDLLTFAKGVNSGYSPLGGVIMTREIAAAFDDRAYPGGLTYSGHPLGAALGVATFEVFRRDGILEHVREMESTVLVPLLEKMATAHPSVGEFRGKGLFYALELVKDRETREPLVPFNASGAAAAPMAEVKKACLDGGVFPMVSANRVHIAPPLVISAADLTQGLAVIDAALDKADRHAAQ
jgi:taurine---2-oxoglutarate transaminase